MKTYISWRRVSTGKQGKSGLGLDAQKTIIEYFANIDGEIVEDYCEVYTGTSLSGCTELRKAMQQCKEIGATLIIAKSDRFRNVIEALSIYEEMEGKIVFCDLPNTDKFTLTLFFALAEREALLVGLRTQSALDAKRKRGEAMGGDARCWGMKAEHMKNLSTEERAEYREETLNNARKASAENRRAKAMSNPKNTAFWYFITDYIKINGEPRPRTDYWTICAQELNKRGLTTSTGRPFTNGNACSTYCHLKEMFN